MFGLALKTNYDTDKSEIENKNDINVNAWY